LTRLSFSPRATQQVDIIYRYIARDSVNAAQRVVDRIYEIAEFVRSHPGAGRATTVRGLRMFVVNPYPYLVFFRHFGVQDEVRIVRIFHAAQRRPGLSDVQRTFQGNSAF
jgi:toxin ParE1/3/4